MIGKEIDAVDELAMDLKTQCDLSLSHTQK